MVAPKKCQTIHKLLDFWQIKFLNSSKFYFHFLVLLDRSGKHRRQLIEDLISKRVLSDNFFFFFGKLINIAVA